MNKTLISIAVATMLLTTNSFAEVSAQRVAAFVHWYPAMEQVKMRDEWRKKNKSGEWQFTGDITAKDRTVVTPQAGTNYGYTWFNISNEPVVITMPKYSKYYSLSIFDMNHFMEVEVKPEKPVVIRLPHQKSPIKDAHEIVLQTYQGIAFSRQVIVDNTDEVMKLAKEIKISGGGGDYPFIIPDFSKEEQKEGLKLIAAYMNAHVKDGTKIFGSVYEGVGDMDRAAGVMVGQLGTQARYAQYGRSITDSKGEKLDGKANYEITVPADGLVRSKDGYWTLTVYNIADRFLIPNDKNIYYISSYNAKANPDGTYTLRINPTGEGENAIPTEGKDFTTVFRVYEPVKNVQFPAIEKK